MNVTPVQQRINEGLTSLRALGDEIRLQLHLGGLEAKDRWAKLEPKIHEAEKAATAATEVSRKAIEEILQDWKNFRNTLNKA